MGSKVMKRFGSISWRSSFAASTAPQSYRNQATTRSA
jgi:hypothetical protein